MKDQIRNSALWAAYGDALGFITEFADAAGVKRRIHRPEVTETVAWKRTIGGRFGAMVDLPAGCYSDDTQLRLATCRSILGDGHFDVETFAKVELTVWPAYALGGGKGTKAAAAALISPDVNWFSNFFHADEVRYLDAGGNGAAMRIQPHVWAAKDKSEPHSFLGDVVRNAVCSHGHPRGILGAVFHALCLADALCRRDVPGPEEWTAAIGRLNKVLELVETDSELSAFWRPVWEERVGSTLKTAIDRIIDELSADVDRVATILHDGDLGQYRAIAESLGCLTSEYRGCGTKTALAASALAWLGRKSSPDTALVAASNLLSSDTDTIATMAGAILGAVSEKGPESEIMDRAYIEVEADRLAKLSMGVPTPSFAYPDLMRWTPPRTQLDALVLHGDRLVLAGLGYAESISEEFRPRGKADHCWQWMKLDFGQSVVGKRRARPSTMAQGNMPLPSREPRPASSSERHNDKKTAATQQRLFEARRDMEDVAGQTRERTKSIDELSAEAIRSGFEPSLIGRHLLGLAEGTHGVEKAIAYASIIAKAKLARVQTQKRQTAAEPPTPAVKDASAGEPHTGSE